MADKIAVFRGRAGPPGKERERITVVLPTRDGDIELEIPLFDPTDPRIRLGRATHAAVVTALARLQEAVASPSNAKEFGDLER